jgi:hypothetical protein
MSWVKFYVIRIERLKKVKKIPENVISSADIVKFFNSRFVEYKEQV